MRMRPTFSQRRSSWFTLWRDPEPAGRLAALAEDVRAARATARRVVEDLGHDTVGKVAQERMGEDPFELAVHGLTL
jgi:hypothetical protein